MENIKNLLDKYEVETLENKAEELADIDDLWYFIKSSAGAWIAGSTR